ncbi:hypothetical protein [Dokdonia sp.]|uniref:hypothetical protein n=1 Tax=Dokdonia sp. TaxID=2024995 RepID=UPI0032662E5A
MRFVCVILLLVYVQGEAQEITPVVNDSLSVLLFERGTLKVNKCTPWHHLQCVYITGTEVYKDGREGKSTRHWWRMSYIGRACTAQHGTVFGKVFEGFFAIPHYISIGIGNGVGYMVYLLRGSPEKIQARKQKKQERKSLKKAARQKKKNRSG